jgi:transglutaminase superfamily protein/tetratricopeptide repeat protein
MSRKLFPALAVGCALALFGAASGRAAPDPDVQMLFEKAKALAKDGKYDQAAELMRKAVKLAPGNDQVLAITSELERQAGEFTQALEHARQALRINDKAGPYHVLAAAAAYGTQDLDAAREHVQKLLKAGPSGYGEGPYKDAQRIDALLRPKTYTITWQLEPRKARSPGPVLPVALPRGDLPYQKVSYKVVGARVQRVVKGEANSTLYVVPQGDKPFQLITTVTVEPYSYRSKLAKRTAAPLPAEARAYLGAGEGYDPAGAKVQKTVRPLKSRDAVETVNNVLSWMKKNITYRHDTKSITELDFKTVDDILERGHAECRGYTVLFVALCRAAGVPARPVWGVALVPGGKPDYASHNWAEVYVGGVGWVPVDPQRPESFGFLPTSVVRVFMDAKKGAATQENLPLLNLLFMNGDRLKYEESASGRR